MAASRPRAGRASRSASTASLARRPRRWTRSRPGCWAGPSPKKSSSATGNPLVIYAGTIFLSSFLLFLVQPLIARLILPWFGGSAAVWTTCMLFFQALLLAGYAYAHFLNRFSRRRFEALLHTALLAVALATLPIAPGEVWKPSG